MAKNKILLLVFLTIFIVGCGQIIYLDKIRLYDDVKGNSPPIKSYSIKIRKIVAKSIYEAYTGKEKGFVYVQFMVSKDGAIYDTTIEKNRCVASEAIENFVLDTIYKISPLPEFPRDLQKKYKGLKFIARVFVTNTPVRNIKNLPETFFQYVQNGLSKKQIETVLDYPDEIIQKNNIEIWKYYFGKGKIISIYFDGEKVTKKHITVHSVGQ